MNYERKDSVNIDEYIRMITLKTAALLACSCKTGALIAHANETEANLIYDFGKNMGIAFQLHDDILDVYGDELKFGKQTGGDIIANKKTFVLLKALEMASGIQLAELNRWISAKDFDPMEKVMAVKDIFSSLEIREASEKKMNDFFEQSMRSLDRINVPEDRKTILRSFAQVLMVREV